MRISDWSSDVCSSDLHHGLQRRAHPGEVGEAVAARSHDDGVVVMAEGGQKVAGGSHGDGEDRKSVVSGKSVSVRVDLGGRRLIKKKKHIKPTELHYKCLH